MDNPITVSDLASLKDLNDCLASWIGLIMMTVISLYCMYEIISLWKLRRSIKKEGKDPLSYICQLYMDRYFKYHPIEDPIAEKIAKRLKEAENENT